MHNSKTHRSNITWFWAQLPHIVHRGSWKQPEITEAKSLHGVLTPMVFARCDWRRAAVMTERCLMARAQCWHLTLSDFNAFRAFPRKQWRVFSLPEQSGEHFKQSRLTHDPRNPYRAVLAEWTRLSTKGQWRWQLQALAFWGCSGSS